eukprot:8718_1
MGIDKLLQELKPITKPVKLHELRGQTCGVEAQQSQHGNLLKVFEENVQCKRMTDGDFVYFRPLDKYPSIYFIANINEGYLIIKPMDFRMDTTFNCDDVGPSTLINVHQCVKDWDYYVDEFLKYIGCSSHILVGGSVYKNNGGVESKNKWKKNQQKHQTKPTIALYAIIAANNRERYRQTFLTRLMDQVGRASFDKYLDERYCEEDDAKYDGIASKFIKMNNRYPRNGERPQRNGDEEMLKITDNVASYFYEHNFKSYAECYRSLIKDLSSDDNQHMFSCDTVRRLCKGERIPDSQMDGAKVLGAKLIEYQQLKRRSNTLQQIQIAPRQMTLPEINVPPMVSPQDTTHTDIASNIGLLPQISLFPLELDQLPPLSQIPTLAEIQQIPSIPYTGHHTSNSQEQQNSYPY